MAMGFLCETYRELLVASPGAARSAWRRWMERGCDCCGEGEWQRAQGYLGRSFELAELMLDRHRETSPCKAPRRIDRFMVSGHLLAECFERCERVGLARHCLLAVHHRLLSTMREQPQAAPSLRTNLEISLHMLKRHFSARDEFALFAPCYNESMLMLQRTAC